MVARRRLLTGGFVTGLVAAALPAPVDASDTADDRTDQAIATALIAIRNELYEQRRSCAPPLCPAVEELRRHQKTHLKTNQRFPDFIDVGVDIWETVQDWHIATRQPLSISKLPDGRYGLLFGLTTLVLRPDALNSFISLPYDGR